MFSEESKAAVEDYLKNEKFKKYMLINMSSSTIVLRSDDLKYIESKAGEYHQKTGTPHLIVEAKGVSEVVSSHSVKQFKRAS